jgi:hypothetical protein
MAEEEEAIVNKELLRGMPKFHIRLLFFIMNKS